MTLSSAESLNFKLIFSQTSLSQSSNNFLISSRQGSIIIHVQRMHKGKQWLQKTSNSLWHISMIFEIKYLKYRSSTVYFILILSMAKRFLFIWWFILQDILSSYVGKGFNLRTSSRTDKGVHAVSNVLKLNINDP